MDRAPRRRRLADSSFSLLRLVVDSVLQPVVHVLLAEAVVRGPRALDHTRVGGDVVCFAERPVVAFVADEPAIFET